MKYYFLALGTLVIVCVGCITDGSQVFDTGEYHAPPAGMLQRPGPMVDGPGPGVLNPIAPPQPLVPRVSQVRFVGPRGMQIGWQIPTGYAENQLVAPARYNYVQGGTYRLKVSNIPARDGLVLYPTLQVYPAHPTTDAYLSHNSIPIEITDEDLDQVEFGNYVTKVIYLPDPRFQDLAVIGVETLVSTRLDPGIDPVAEASRRGTIMAVLRMGNMDQEMPGHVFGPPPAGPMGLPGDNGDAEASLGGGYDQIAYHRVDGDAGVFVPPMPIGGVAAGMMGVPTPGIFAGGAIPGEMAMHPVAGLGPIPAWGMPMTGTPVGLPGPPHLPHGGPAGLKSHTVRNRTDVELGKPVDHMLIDVEHDPGIRLPKPVRHVKYKETHPVYREQGELAYPQWYGPGH